MKIKLARLGERTIAPHLLLIPQLDRPFPNPCGNCFSTARNFRIVELENGDDRLGDNNHPVEWILEQQSPFDSLYYYRSGRSIHISYGFLCRQSIWSFTSGLPTREGTENWIEVAKRLN